jgi:hypothetical protein
MNKKIFTGKLNGNDVEIAVKTPTAEELREADKIHGKIFTEEFRGGTLISDEIDGELRKRGIWNDELEKKYTDVRKRLLDNEYQLVTRTSSLAKGKHGTYDKNTYYGKALEMRELRNELVNLMSIRSSLDSMTAEGKANNAKHNYLIYACTVYDNSNKRVFPSYEDFLSKSIRTADNEEWFQIALAAAEAFQEIYFGQSSNIQDLLPENQWLKKYGFVDGTYHLVNKDGKRINASGKLVDELGRVIDEEGNFLDANERPFDDTGSYLVEPKPFLDDDGNPVLDDDYKAELDAYKTRLTEWKKKKSATKKETA